MNTVPHEVLLADHRNPSSPRRDSRGDRAALRCTAAVCPGLHVNCPLLPDLQSASDTFTLCFSGHQVCATLMMRHMRCKWSHWSGFLTSRCWGSVLTLSKAKTPPLHFQYLSCWLKGERLHSKSKHTNLQVSSFVVLRRLASQYKAVGREKLRIQDHFLELSRSPSQDSS